MDADLETWKQHSNVFFSQCEVGILSSTTALQHEYDKETTETVTAEKSSFLADIPGVKYAEY